MNHSKGTRHKRGAAILYLLAITAILLLVFSTTFQSFHLLRQVNGQALVNLQERAAALRIERTESAEKTARVQEPVSIPESE